MSYKTHTLTQMPWGYEQPIAITTTDGKVYEEVLKFDNEPTSKMVDDAAKAREDIIEARTEKTRPVFIEKEEIEKVLREKGYLTEEQKWEDLPEKQLK